MMSNEQKENLKSCISNVYQFLSEHAGKTFDAPELQEKMPQYDWTGPRILETFFRSEGSYFLLLHFPIR